MIGSGLVVNANKGNAVVDSLGVTASSRISWVLLGLTQAVRFDERGSGCTGLIRPPQQFSLFRWIFPPGRAHVWAMLRK